MNWIMNKTQKHIPLECDARVANEIKRLDGIFSLVIMAAAVRKTPNCNIELYMLMNIVWMRYRDDHESIRKVLGYMRHKIETGENIGGALLYYIIWIVEGYTDEIDPATLDTLKKYLVATGNTKIQVYGQRYSVEDFDAAYNALFCQQ